MAQGGGYCFVMFICRRREQSESKMYLIPPSSNYTLQTWLTLQNQIPRSCLVLREPAENPSLSLTASHKSLLNVSGVLWKIHNLRMPQNGTWMPHKCLTGAPVASFWHRESQSEVHFYARARMHVWLPGEMTEAWPLASVSDRNDVHSEWQTGSYNCCTCTSAGSAWH